MPSADFECQKCGKCCRLLAVVLPLETMNISEELWQIDGHGAIGQLVVMKLEKDGYCIALDRETRLCTIYEKRPASCREFPFEEDRRCLSNKEKEQE